ncbi:hypothetical protein ABPG77_003523 [Micractinium sp. CCAP 211/92]
MQIVVDPSSQRQHRLTLLAGLIMLSLSLTAVSFLRSRSRTAQRLTAAGGRAGCDWQAPPHPRKEAYERLQADPDLASREPSLLAECEAAPWLLPPRTPALPYAGLHDLGRLLGLRARTLGGQRVVTLLQFNRRFAELVQNCVYSLVKFGGVRSYVVATWTPEDLAACAELNLPCADVAALLPRPLPAAPAETRAVDGDYLTPEWLSIVWLKPRLVLEVLQLGYAVLFTDADVAWGRKAFSAEESLLALVRQSHADGAFIAENPVNTGVFFVLPSPPTINVLSRMASLTHKALEERLLEQAELKKLADWEFVVCGSRAGCHNKRHEMQTKHWDLALFRTFPPSSFLETSDICALEHGVRWGAQFHPRIDPCDSTALFVHTICVTGLASKRAALRGVQWWFLDAEEATEACPTSPGGLPLCRPLQWRLPGAEAAQYSCTARPWLGLPRAQVPRRSAPPAGAG